MIVDNIVVPLVNLNLDNTCFSPFGISYDVHSPDWSKLETKRHVANAEDRGGNTIIILMGREGKKESTNLHALWYAAGFAEVASKKVKFQLT